GVAGHRAGQKSHTEAKSGYIAGVSKHYKNPGRNFGEPERIDSSDGADPMSDPRIERELDDREQLIWAGTPDPALMGRRALPILIFGIPWTAFSVFWILGVSGVLIGRIG